MERARKRIASGLIVLMLVSLLATTGIVLPEPALAAAPAALPSQIAISIAGGAEVGKSAMSFNWITDTTVDKSEIVYGISPGLEDGVTISAALKVPVATDIFPENRRTGFKEIHSFHVVIQDLTPETRYYYKVGNATEGYSAIASFVAPANPDSKEPFSFVVTPDTQGYDVASFRNTALMYDHIKANESDAAFLLHMGDVVEDGHISDEWQWFFEAAQNLTSTMPILATPGNHDAASYDRDFVQYKARFNHTSLRKPAGLSAAADGTVYAFEYGDALFISLNSFASSADDKIQWEFLADEAAATTKKWKIAYLHVDPYDPGASHYAVDNVTGKKFTDAGIDLVLAGHEHGYARTTLKTTSTAAGLGSIEKAEFGKAPTYITGGSVYDYGYSLHPSNDTSFADFFYDIRIDKSGTGGGKIYSPGVYSKVDVTSNAITYTAYYKATGEQDPFRVIDTFTITSSGDEVTQPIGGGQAPHSVTFMYDNFNEQTRKPEPDKYIARFNWVTPVTTKTSQLFYAKKSDFDSNGGKFTDFVMGTNFTVDLRSNIEALKYTGAGTQYSVEPVQSHKAETAVLEPNTEYVYSVGDGAKNVTSVTAPASFKTPASKIDTFNFNWISDAQANDTKGYEATLKQYNEMSKKALTQAFTDFPDAAFVVSSGDQVNFGFDTWEWDAFFEANQDLFSRVPLYMATGNHEFDGAGNSWANNSWIPVDPTLQNFLGRHNPPKNGASFYGGGDGTERMVSGTTKLQLESSNYYFVYGDTLFLVMDYQDQSSKEQIKAQQDWMKAVVKQNPTKWRVGMFHKTLFGYRMPAPVASWTDAFDEAGIDVVLMGHDHIYARTKLFANGKVVAEYGEGTTYLTNYSANKDNRGPLYLDKYPDHPEGGNPAIAYIDISSAGRGYANISISPDEIRVTSRAFDKADNLQDGDVHELVTNKPRTYDLQDWQYPAVPQEVNEFTITKVAVNGIAKEGQTLSASVTPASATASFKWERSTDGTAWTAIDGATAANYVVKAADVGSYLRAVATATGFYNGVVTSTATGKVTSLAGGGTANTVKIKSASDLVALSQKFGTSEYPVDGIYELTADIDMQDEEFSAIGGGATRSPFIGTFNGKGYTISNLKISSSNNGTGFFAHIGAGGRVVNLKLTNVDITGESSTGAIAGSSIGTIENSYVDGKVTGAGYTGGIVGLLYSGTLQNNFLNVEVNGTTIGGLIGGTNYNGSGSPGITVTDTPNIIVNNYVSGTVNGEGDYYGGIVGDMGGSSGSVLKSFTGNALSTSVTGTSSKIAGYWSGSRPIEDLKNDGITQVNYYADDKQLSTSGLPSGIFTSKPAAEFEQQATYEVLGWDFTNVWDWDATNNIPVPRVLDLGDEEEEEDNFVTIIASAGAGGKIEESGYVLVERGQSKKFTFTPNKYFEIDTVLVDGVENAEAAAAGEYTFDNVTAVHTIQVTFKLSDGTSGMPPSVVSTSAYYNRAVEEHIWVTVDFGSGALGIQEGSYRNAVNSVKMMKDGELVLDAQGGFWFPSTGYGAPEDRLEICYDDIEGFPGYENLIPGTYDLVITFADLNATVVTIPLYVEDRIVSDLTVEGGTIAVDGESADSPAKVKVDAQVTVTADVPEGQRFVSWTASGLDHESYTVNPLTFAMPSGPVVLTAEFENVSMMNADLSDLTVDGESVSGFDADILEYTVNVPNSKTSVTVAATAADSNATIAFEGGDDLAVGNNTVTVTVTAGDEATTKVYTITVKRAAASGNSGGGTTTPPADDSQITLPAGIGGTARFENNAVTITVPVGASEKQLTITVNKVLDASQLVTDSDVLLSPVYEILKNFKENFTKPITITLTFDPTTVGANQIPSLFYYDEEKKVWVEIGGKASGDQISAEVDHFTKFAVFAVEKKAEEKPGNEPEENADTDTTFSDVTGHWAEESIKQAAAKGIVAGYTDGTFKPNGEITRAQFAVMLARALKLDVGEADLAFTDKASIDDWAKQGIAQAVQAGIVKGYSDGSFRPNAKISRAEMVTMIANALGIANNASAATAFADTADIPTWAVAAISATVEKGIVQGVGGNKFAPNQTATRAQAAVILLRALEFAGR